MSKNGNLIRYFNLFLCITFTCTVYNFSFLFTGCFNDSFLSDISTDMYINVTMWKNAVGICLETCQRKNTTVFAVKVKQYSYINIFGINSYLL